MAELTDDQSYRPSEIDTRRVGAIRLAIGAVQGIVAWLLLELVPPMFGIWERSPPDQAMWWSNRHPGLFAVLVLVTAVMPVVAMVQVGRMRWRRLVVYLAVTIAALAVIAMQDIYRQPWDGTIRRVWPSASLLFCAAIGQFILNQLIEHHERGHRLFDHYAEHFEDSWMRGFQLAVSLLFTLLVWGVLALGGGLFDLIHLDWFSRMIAHNWFRCPVLAMAFAASIHITDVRPALLKGVRNLGLTLLSWLLPLIVLLGCGFLVALIFTGLQPLWNTRNAATILIWSAAVTLLLLNAAYKDGEPAHAPVAPIRWAGRIAGPMMLVFTILTAFALAQRVGQYGWTGERVWLGAVTAIALLYAGGYTWASVDRSSWLKRLERVNAAVSLAILVVLAVFLVPVADPTQLAVSDQLARLKAGKVIPARFDYEYLRFKAGRYGAGALARLMKSDNAEISARAKMARKAKEPSSRWADIPVGAITEPAFSHATVYPRGSGLPADFRSVNWADQNVSDNHCLKNGSPCEIFLLGKAPVSLLLVRDELKGEQAGLATVYRRGASEMWERYGTVRSLSCPGVVDALRKGEATPLPKLDSDLQANGVRLVVTHVAEPSCSEPDVPRSKSQGGQGSSRVVLMRPVL